jgi:NDP-sugar pyrophosphorylase family protein
MPVEMPSEYARSRPLAAQSAKVAVCILAAGIAKRLEPISAVIAKPAFPLGGRVPIAELWVRRFADAGLRALAMNLHRVPDSIQSYFGDGRRFLADIAYVHEDTPSGTLGGAVKMLRALQARGVHPERVFIPSGDIVSGIETADLERMLHEHARGGAAFTMMLAPVPWERRADFGTVVLEGTAAGSEVAAGTFARVREFLEKDPRSPSNENNASNYLVETSLLLELESSLTAARPDAREPCYDFGKHVLQGMVGGVPHLGFLTRYKNDVYGYEPGQLWFDVGNKRDYLAVNRAVTERQVAVELPYAKYPWGWLGDDVAIDFGAVRIVPPVVIGHRCRIGAGAELGPHAILGDGWTVGAGARVRDAVLWPHYDFPPTAGRAPRGSPRSREIRGGIDVDTAIVVGGVIERDVREQTVDPRPDGALDVTGIDWVPPGERA